MIVVDVTSASGQQFMTKAAVREVVGFVCGKEKVKSAEFSFVIVNDAMIRSINKKFLKHDYVTDIITFPMEQKSIVAEIYINAQQMTRQAKELGVTKRNEMTRLVVHGILHAIGYEDTTAAKKKKMDAVQERYVAALSSKE
jgi:probable rRNA maturation factor